MAAFLSSRQTFLPEVIPEGEYTRKKAMSISDILSFWSTLLLKYWQRYINFKIWPILWLCDAINDTMNIYSYNCSHNLKIHMHRKFNDIFARCLIIMKNVIISFIKENRGPTLRPPCDVINDVIVMKILFWHNLERSFQIWGQIEAMFNISKFSKWPLFWARDNFFAESYTGCWIYQKDSHEHFRHFELLIDAPAQILTRYITFKIWPTLWPGDVIDDVMSAWNITCTTRHPQQCTCKILFVWHQSFIVKSSGQTSW